jgi:hypothetical protein
MSTLIYSPQIRVRVATRNHGVLDISDDLVQGTLNIRTNAVHTFSFQLQNTQRKYDGKIRPMDRIVVEMKRITWVRVFSGYLNNGPIFSVWPRVLNLSASCTLKRLQFWYWDSTAPASQKLILGQMSNNGQDTSQPSHDTGNILNETTLATGGITGHDSAVRETVVRVLTEVVGWPQEKVHIAQVPGEWYKMAEQLYASVIQKTKIPDELFGDFTSGGTVGGTAIAGGIGAGGTLQQGSYGGQNYSAEQAANASTIYNVAASRGLPARAAVIAIATAWQESNLRNLNYGDRDSLGLFQQRPSQGWGTPAQLQDPTYAANKFYDALVAVPGWETMPVTTAAQKVQRSAFPNAYAKWETTAQAAVDVLSRTAPNSTANAQGGQTTPPGFGSVVGQSGAGTGVAAAGSAPVGSGRNVALVATNLIQRNPPGHIRYSLGGDDHYTSADPRVLDCSSFVDWVYYHAVGRPWLTPRGTAAQQQAASQRISVESAKYIKGALLFIGSPAHHVEVSLGNGKTAAAHTDGVPLEQQVNVSPAGNGWTNAGLMPGVDYRDAATNQAAATELGRVINQPTAVTDPNETGTGIDASGLGAGAGGAAGPDGNAAFNAFVNVYVWGFQSDFSGALFQGPVALMNDEPILPWISNMMATIMRAYCSAPNGDFIAWFPDYFGLWNSAAKMNVKPIEIQDFTVEWYDQEIVTHQYVVGTPVATFDTRTATVAASAGGAGANSGLYMMLATDGVATMDFPEIFQAIFGLSATQQFIDEYLDRFGGRPNTVNIPTISWHSGAEFFMALYLFMQRWANQFRAEVPMTFMPELWPGMLLVLPDFQFQAYILEVSHSFKFGKGGGFTTTAKICAPARTSQKTDIFGLLPLSGSARTPTP